MANTSLQIIRKLGKELTFEEVSIINKARKKYFHVPTIIAPSPNNEDWNKSYFLLYTAKNKLTAFMRLHVVKVLFEGTYYDIFGSATLISLVEGKGYGGMLKKAVREYTDSLGKTTIGFCNPKLSPYYKRLGFGIIPDGAKQFYLLTPEATHKQFILGNDVVYSEGKDRLMSQILNNPKESVLTNRYHW